MKKSITIGLLSLVVLLAAIFGALPYFFGIKAEETLQEQNKILSENAFLEVTEHTYQRGWFSSEEKTVVRLKPQFIKSYLNVMPENLAQIANASFTLVNHVKHGPFAGGQFARAVVQTEVEYNETVAKNLKRFFADKPPLSIENTLHLLGGGHLQINIANVDYEELSGIKVAWQGLSTGIDYQGNFDAYTILSQSPSLKVTLADKGMVSYDALKYTSFTEQSASKLSVGNSQFNLGALQLKWNDEVEYNIRVNDILNKLSDLQVGSFINPTGNISANSLTLNDFEFASSMAEKDKFINATGAMKFKSLAIGEDKYGPLDVMIKADHLDAPSLFALRKKVSEIGSQGLTGEEFQKQVVAAARTEGLPLFTNSPLFTIERFDLTMPEGTFKASGHLGFKGLTKADMDDFSAMLTKTDAKLNISAPQRLLEMLGEAQATKFISVDPEMPNPPSEDEIKKMGRDLVNSAIQGMAHDGFIKLENGQFSTTVTFKDKQFLMNDKKVGGDRPEDDIDHLTEEVGSEAASQP